MSIPSYNSVHPLTWVFHGGRVAQSSSESSCLTVTIKNKLLHSLYAANDISKVNSSQTARLDLNGMMVLPGLINAHDHLEFGCFPRLGDGPYEDARAWALDVYHPDQSPIRELQQISKPTRLFWGGLKNLFSGVTTVCHHNPYENAVFDDSFPVRILDRYGWSHSFAFSEDVRADFNRTPTDTPFMIHAAEGTTTESRAEISRLERMGLLNAQTVIVHGVALQTEEWKALGRRGVGLIWCPSSNLFTLGKTVDLNILRSTSAVALGNDSPLTAQGDFLDEIHIAMSFGIDPDLLYSMVTENASRLLRLKQGQGQITAGSVANLLIVKDNGDSPAQRLISLSTADIELVMLEGRPMLTSLSLARQLPPSLLCKMQRVIYGETEWWIQLDVLSHWQETAKFLGKKFRLAGKMVSIGFDS